MISKLIVWAENREKAIAATHEALNNYEILGLKTNIKFVKRVLMNSTFQTGKFDTSFIEQFEEELIGVKTLSEEAQAKQKLSVVLMHIWSENEKLRNKRKSSIDPWSSSDNFRVNYTSKREVEVEDQNGESLVCEVQYLAENKFNVSIGDHKFEGVEFF